VKRTRVFEARDARRQVFDALPDFAKDGRKRPGSLSGRKQNDVKAKRNRRNPQDASRLAVARRPSKGTP
jgi:hypothetical protein